jgi:two-component system CheB/CheR fusion protein
MKSKSPTKSENQQKHKVIVAIGASQGGAEAMQAILQHLAFNTGLIYTFMQDTDFDLGVITQLKQHTDMPILEAKQGEELKPDHVYVIDSKQPLMVVEGIFQPSTLLPDSPYATMPINQFFSLLADNYKEAAIGVLLSGTTLDGALGLRAIKMAGGISLVQDDSAQHATMPKHAIAEEVVDLVLSPGEIADELNKIGKRKEIYYSAIADEDDSLKTLDEDLTAILHLLYRSVGVDFSQYKMSTIKRRIMRRMMLFKQASLGEYLQYIKQHVNEVNLLYQDLLINVTTFFRDQETTQYLKETILPRIIRSKLPNDPIRIWVPACSTGQEAYSLAILIIEALGDRSASTPVQIFATDLSDMAINKARLGLYSKDDVVDVSAHRLERFFNKVDGHYRIVKSIRDMCVFATHNIVKDPPFSRLDIISCCNLMIYLEPSLQKKLMATFHYSLQNNGFLVVGKSETVGASAYLFTLVEKKYKVYTKKKDATVSAVFEMNYRTPEQTRVYGLRNTQTTPKPRQNELDLDRVVNQLLLKSYIPACVVVNQELDILQFRGSTGLYLEPSPGKACLNLMKMARQGLGFELRNIVHKAAKTGTPAKKEGLEIINDKKAIRISIEAVPLRSEVETEDQFFAVLFEQSKQLIDDGSTDTAKDNRVKMLEAELVAMREDMRSIIESQEAANEELQSANEEIVSSNEELQSINEELETSKEEIESSNEELITINQELQMRNEQLAEVQEYSAAILNIIRESILILDKDLRVKSANTAFYHTFKVKEGEIDGRYIYELGNGQWNIPKLKELLHEIIPTNTQFFGFEVIHHFPGIGEKVMVLNARKLAQRVHGHQVILLAIEDITEHRQAQKIISDRENWFRNMADNAPVMIWVTGLNKLVTFCNKTWLQFRGIAMDGAVTTSWLEGAHPEDLSISMEQYEKAFAAKEPFTLQYRVKRFDGVYKWVLTKARPNYTADGAFDGFIGSCIELPDALAHHGV